MSKISLYTASHTDPAHIREFYFKKLLREGETALAVFDGIFYEAKNERVGGLAFHDYLIFSNKSIYIWARGVQKDYLDRFNLGAVTFKSKRSDDDFATLDITIARADKDPINLIFDLVPINETEKITFLSLSIDSVIESRKGKNFLDSISDELALEISEVAKQTLKMKEFEFVEIPTEPQPNINPEPSTKENYDPMSGFFGASQPEGYDVEQPSPRNGGTYIYGETVLDRIRAMRSGESLQQQHEQYSAEFLREEPRMSQNRYGMPPPPIENPFKNLDFISLKRAEAITKDLFAAIPVQYREQAKKDLEQMPKRMTEAVSVMSELLTNITQNPETQNFVIQAIATAVKNDGIVGTMMKAMNSAVQTASGPPPSQSAHQSTGSHEHDSNATEPNLDQTKDQASESNGQTGISGNQRKKIKITID